MCESDLSVVVQLVLSSNLPGSIDGPINPAPHHLQLPQSLFCFSKSRSHRPIFVFGVGLVCAVLGRASEQSIHSCSIVTRSTPGRSDCVRTRGDGGLRGHDGVGVGDGGGVGVGHGLLACLT